MIKFKQVKFKNFGSFGNYYTTINFESHNMTLVSGPNGHGKSYALLDSITFALFGKPFRKINIPQLVNTINNKNCLVEVDFSVGTDVYKVIRGLKPKKFEIYKNDTLIEQSAKSKDYQKLLEEQILKMNYKAFNQIVTLGSSSYIPFMQLTPADRREVIEDILNINIFSNMNTVIKGKMSTIKETILEQKKTIEVLNEKISLQEDNIKNLKEKKNKSIQNNKEKIEELKNKINDLLNEVDELNSNCENVKVLEKEKNKLNTNFHKTEALIFSLIKKKKDFEENLEFYSNTDVCPSCSQSIAEDIKEVKKEEVKKKIDEVEDAIKELKNLHKKTKQDIDDVIIRIKEVEAIQRKVNEKQNSISAAEKYMTSLIEMYEKTDTFDDSIEESRSKKTEYEKEILTEREKLDSLMEEKSNLDVLLLLLKDSGIKAKIIKNYLPKINEIINKYLNKMNFFVSFMLDEEFNEQIKSRHRDAFGYMSFSEGEKSRIDLAILLAWREIAKIKNSAHCNLLILDEIFDSSMDSSGVDDLMQVLKSLSKTSNIFVITHKTDQLSDRFQKQVSFKKKNNFSKMIG